MVVIFVEDDGGYFLLGIIYFWISWLEKDSNKDFIYSVFIVYIYKVKVYKLGLLFKRYKSISMCMFVIEKLLLLYVKFMIRWSR